ncbi:MAG TPA: hypothetical protein VGK67_08075 [Myxococcales bacterium]|jgi:arylsulfatase
MSDWKVGLAEQRAKQMMCWAEPFVKLRVPKMFNLRRDPFERADRRELEHLLGLGALAHLPALRDAGSRRGLDRFRLGRPALLMAVLLSCAGIALWVVIYARML